MDKKTRVEHGYTFEWVEEPEHSSVRSHWDLSDEISLSGKMRIIPASESGDGKWHIHAGHLDFYVEDGENAERDSFEVALRYLLSRYIKEARLVERQIGVRGAEETVIETLCVETPTTRRFHITKVTDRNLDRQDEISAEIHDEVRDCPGDCQPELTVTELARVRDLIRTAMGERPYPKE